MLDETNQKIIDILKENARTSVRNIAKQLGLSPAAISKRISKLEREGIIKKYTAIIENKEIESSCSLTLMIKVGGEENPDVFGKKLSKLPEICTCMRITGYYDILALANCKSPSEVSGLLNKVKEWGRVDDINTALVIEKYKVLPTSYKIVQDKE